SGWSNNTSAWVDGADPRGTVSSGMRWNAVGPDYFRVLGTPLLLGRDFTDSDTADAPKVVIVNETFAQRYLQGRSPLGRNVGFSPGKDDPQYAILSVTADSKYTGVRERSVPMAYFPYTQIAGAGTMH